MTELERHSLVKSELADSIILINQCPWSGIYGTSHSEKLVASFLSLKLPIKNALLSTTSLTYPVSSQKSRRNLRFAIV